MSARETDGWLQRTAGSLWRVWRRAGIVNDLELERIKKRAHLSFEVFLQRPLALSVVLERDVAVWEVITRQWRPWSVREEASTGREGAGENGNVAKHGLKGLVEDCRTNEVRFKRAGRGPRAKGRTAVNGSKDVRKQSSLDHWEGRTDFDILYSL